jgi:hypothetical protein
MYCSNKLKYWVWDWIHSHTPPRTRSPSSRHPPFTHYPFPPRSLVYGGQAGPHKPRLVVSHSTCPPLSSSPHAHSFELGTAVINTHNKHTHTCTRFCSNKHTLHPRNICRGQWRCSSHPRIKYPRIKTTTPANSFVIGTAVINTHEQHCNRRTALY